MNNSLLISIKTKYANQIFLGTKQFEFRRKSIGEHNCNKKIYVYSSSQDKSIIGYIIVDKILKGNLEYILNTTNNKNNQEIIDYFDNCMDCHALHIKEARLFIKPIKLKELKDKYNNFCIPQFYRYINKDSLLSKDLEEKEIR